MIVSIALGVATWMATQTLNESLHQAGRRAIAPLAGQADFYISNGDAGVPHELANGLGQVDGVCWVRPLVIRRVILPEFDARPALVLGVDLPQTENAGPSEGVEVGDLALSSLLENGTPALWGKGLVEALPPGTRSLHVLVSGQLQRFSRIGTIQAARGPLAVLAGNVLVLPCKTAAALDGRPDLVSRLDIFLHPGTDSEAAACHLRTLLGDRAHLQSPKEHDQFHNQILAGLTVAFSLGGTAALLIGLFLIANVLSVSVAERRRDIGILRSLGATRGQVRGLFLGEAVFLGLIGTVVGLPLGLGLAALSLGPVQQILGDYFLPLQEARLAGSSVSLFGAASAGLLASFLAAVIPAAQAAAELPVNTCRRVVPAIASRWVWLRVGSSFCLLILGAVAVVAKDRLPARWGVLAGLVLSSVAGLLLIPLLAAVLARAAQGPARRFLGIAARLAADNLVRASGRTSVVITALAASVALLLLTAGLIRSNEAAVRDWVERSVAGDLFLTSGGPLTASGRTQPMPEELGTTIREMLPGAVPVAFRFRYLDWQQAGRSARVLLVALDASSYRDATRDRRPPLPDSDLYQELSAKPDTALVSENFAVLYGIRPGDQLVLPGANGPVSLRVAGTVVDFSCTQGTILVDRLCWKDSFDAGLVDVFSIFLPTRTSSACPVPEDGQESREAELAREQLLQARCGADHALCALTRPEVRGHILGMVHHMYGLAYAQEILVGLVAVLGVVTALLIAVLQRRRELGLLRAIGTTRSQILGTVLAEALGMGLLGTAIGLAIGWPLEWYALHVLLIDEVGFWFPLRFPWLAALLVAGVALVSATLAGLAPALQAARAEITVALASK